MEIQGRVQGLYWESFKYFWRNQNLLYSFRKDTIKSLINSILKKKLIHKKCVCLRKQLSYLPCINCFRFAWDHNKAKHMLSGRSSTAWLIFGTNLLQSPLQQKLFHLCRLCENLSTELTCLLISVGLLYPAWQCQLLTEYLDCVCAFLIPTLCRILHQLDHSSTAS